MKKTIRCRDKYEAQKLASMLWGKDGRMSVQEILNAIDNEIIVLLADGSAHSIVLEDSSNAEAFADFMQSVLEGTHQIKSVSTADRTVTTSKE